MLVSDYMYNCSRWTVTAIRPHPRSLHGLKKICDFWDSTVKIYAEYFDVISAGFEVPLWLAF